MSIPYNPENFDVVDVNEIPPNYQVDTWVFDHVQSETMDVYLFSGAYTFVDTAYATYSTLINVTGTNFRVTNYTGTNMAVQNYTGANMTVDTYTGTNMAVQNYTGFNMNVTHYTGTNMYVTNFTGTNIAFTNYTGNNMNVQVFTGATGAITTLTVNNLYAPTLATIDTKNALTYDTTSKQVGYYPFSLIPEGTILPYGGASAPSGYLLCDGAAISRTTYARLFAVFGTTYGVGDGATTFNIPNLVGRIPVGRDAGQTEFDTLGEVGGAKTVTLSTAEIPAHDHTGNGTTSLNGSHDHTGNGTTSLNGAHSHNPSNTNNFVTTGSGDSIDTGGAGGIASGHDTVSSTTTEPNHSHTYSFTTSTVADHSHTYSFTTATTGGGGAHNNLQPYIVLNYIVRF